MSFQELQRRLQKPRPRALEKQDRAKARRSTEDVQNALVKARSGGQCEVREAVAMRLCALGAVPVDVHRCRKTARHIHHLIGGIGKRGVRESALAQNKLHVCEADHELIHRHVLQVHWRDVNDRAGTSYCVRLR